MIDLPATISLADDIFRRVHATDRAAPDGTLRIDRGDTHETWIRRGALIFRGTLTFEQLYLVTPWIARVRLERPIGGNGHEPIAIDEGAHVYALPRDVNYVAASRAWWTADRELRAIAHEIDAAIHREDRLALKHPLHSRRMNEALSDWLEGAHTRIAPPLEVSEAPEPKRRAKGKGSCQASGA